VKHETEVGLSLGVFAFYVVCSIKHWVFFGGGVIALVSQPC